MPHFVRERCMQIIEKASRLALAAIPSYLYNMIVTSHYKMPSQFFGYKVSPSAGQLIYFEEASKLALTNIPLNSPE